MPKQEHTGSAIAVTAVTGAQRAQRDFENLAAQRVPDAACIDLQLSSCCCCPQQAWGLAD